MLDLARVTVKKPAPTVNTAAAYSAHQFNKLEMYAFCLPEQSREIHEKILAIEEEIWQELGIPYHVINIAAGDLGAPAAKKIRRRILVASRSSLSRTDQLFELYRFSVQQSKY